MSHRPRVVNGVTHGPRCACPVHDPEGLLVKRARDGYLAAERARRAGAVAAAPVRTLARPFPVVARLPSRGPDRRMKRFHELRRAGVAAADAFAQVDAEHKDGGSNGTS